MFCPSTSTVLFFGCSQADISHLEREIKMPLSRFDLLAGRTDAGGGSRDHLPVSPEERAPAPRDTELGPSS
jgi:hypothetical protein